MDDFGISQKSLGRIKETLNAYQNIEKVIIYGSRAMATHKEGSDIDLTIIGAQFSSDELLQLKGILNDLPIPYKIDLSIFHKIDNPELLEHINQFGKVFYIKQ